MWRRSKTTEMRAKNNTWRADELDECSTSESLLKKRLCSIPSQHFVRPLCQADSRIEAELVLGLGVVKPTRDAKEIHPPAKERGTDVEWSENRFHQETQVIDRHDRQVPARRRYARGPSNHRCCLVEGYGIVTGQQIVIVQGDRLRRASFDPIDEIVDVNHGKGDFAPADHRETSSRDGLEQFEKPKVSRTVHPSGAEDRGRNLPGAGIGADSVFRFQLRLLIEIFRYGHERRLFGGRSLRGKPVYTGAAAMEEVPNAGGCRGAQQVLNSVDIRCPYLPSGDLFPEDSGKVEDCVTSLSRFFEGAPIEDVTLNDVDAQISKSLGARRPSDERPDFDSIFSRQVGTQATADESGSPGDQGPHGNWLTSAEIIQQHDTRSPGDSALIHSVPDIVLIGFQLRCDAVVGSTSIEWRHRRNGEGRRQLPIPLLSPRKGCRPGRLILVAADGCIEYDLSGICVSAVSDENTTTTGGLTGYADIGSFLLSFIGAPFRRSRREWDRWCLNFLQSKSTRRGRRPLRDLGSRLDRAEGRRSRTAPAGQRSCLSSRGSPFQDNRRLMTCGILCWFGSENAL
jgi:hypothetical protein